MPKKIFITRKIPDLATEMLRAKGFFVDTYLGDAKIEHDELIKILKDGRYDAAITMLDDRIDAAIFEAAPGVKIFANYAAGFNNLDLVEAKKRGVAVTNTPSVSSAAVAEHTLALILALANRIVEGDSYVRSGKYKYWMPMGFFGVDLSGKKLGLIGVGNIGKEVARMARNGFGMDIIYYDVSRNEPVEKEYGATKMNSVEDLLKEADVVSLHVPLLDSTHHLINEQRLKLMKPEALLINTSRGPVVDEAALVLALQGKIIRGAGLDVFENEPALAPGLAELSNVVLTPHIASAREDARNEMARIAAHNIIDLFEGKTPHALI